MGTLLMDDLDLETMIRRRNLRTAWRFWFDLKPWEFTQLVDACRLEWGEQEWWCEVMR